MRSSLTESAWLRPFSVLLVCFFSCFVHLGAPEVNLMEARNFVAAREMVQGGSWLIPTMNGALRVAKPPLPTWAVAITEKLTGLTQDPGILRLPAAIMTTLLVFFFWGLVRELIREQPGEAEAPGRTAWLATLVLASSLLVITVGREGHWDIFANSFLVGSLWALARGWFAKKLGWGWFALSGLLLGCSMLSKGPVALYAVLLPFLASFGVLLFYPERGPIRPRRWGLLLALVLGLAVGTAWPIYLAVQHTVAPAALAVARVEVTSWGERHVQPFWEYWNFPVFTGIWTPVALLVLAVPFARPRAGRYIPYRAALAWLLIAFLLLSLVPEKKERYLLPLMPPLAFLIGGMLRHLETVLRNNLRPRPEATLVRVWAGLLAVACCLFPVVLIFMKLPAYGPGSVPFAITLTVFVLLAAAIVRWGFRQYQVPVLMASSITAMALLLALLAPAYPLWTNRRAEPGLRHIAALRRNPALANLPWYTLEELHIKRVWDAGRAAPSWPRTPDSVLVRPLSPIAVLTGSNIAKKLPRAWRDQVRLQVVDSFYLDRQRKDGRWHVTLVTPVSAAE
ncbi:glycosyltransferase family 39 protein [Hymenobacter sp. YC55]|uniref:ArnT family glycosyltransferase n=1 Tax=Hymenobacter sp. YC55 TaxID=3034019 RepID=UPI0023F8BEC9|nr:glycosyltransferase family 39 protein [Hymenobacter sp. YC55]MDF7810332.1 glycosyltransferase family 39 protein [Hymenobacter sp. YC55]